jgi:hypothetical protein
MVNPVFDRPVAKNFVRFEIPFHRHSGDLKLAPLKNGAGIQSFQPPEKQDWTPAFAGVTGGKQAITFGNDDNPCLSCETRLISLGMDYASASK